jgi:hypothetical protein
MTEPKSIREAALGSSALRCAATVVLLAFVAGHMAYGASPKDGKTDVSLVAAASGRAERPTVAVAGNTIRANLASVAAGAFEPAGDGVVDLKTFGPKPVVAALNVPPPGAMTPVTPPTDHIPEPGAIGFGLAVAALIFGNFAKSLMRCWKITGSAPNRES